jgi:hypothetical protein
LAYAPAGCHASNARHIYIKQDRLELVVVQREECFFAG